MKIVWCLFDYRELVSIHENEQIARDALAAEIGDHPLIGFDGKPITGYHLERWELDERQH